jgi:hypothetical protein
MEETVFGKQDGSSAAVAPAAPAELKVTITE